MRPRPLRFDELRAGNKARKTGPGAKTSKKAQAAAAQAAVSAPPPPGGPNGGGPPDEMAGKGEPRDYNLVRRSSVSSSGSSSNGHSDWESGKSSLRAFSLSAFTDIVPKLIRRRVALHHIQVPLQPSAHPLPQATLYRATLIPPSHTPAKAFVCLTLLSLTLAALIIAAPSWLTKVLT